MVTVQHYAHSAKHYAKAIPFPGRLFALPDCCPHPDCRATDALILWGTYERQALTGLRVYRIRVQRIRCKACGRTHSLLPHFLHPYRHYVISLLQRVVYLSNPSLTTPSLYRQILVGLHVEPAFGFRRLLPSSKPPSPT